MKIKDVFDKLSSYNLFNYLFPGFLFVLALKYTTSLIPKDFEIEIITLIVTVYFMGLVISRIGSLVIEEILKIVKKIGVINTKELFNEMKDNIKLEIIFEAMNMYRSLASMSLLMLLITLIDGIIHAGSLIELLLLLAGELILLILFLFAFIKQRGKVLQCLQD